MRSEIKERLEKIREGIIPDGYKKSKIGIIPDDWNEKIIADICTLISGQHIDASDYTENGIGISYLTGPSDFTNNHITTKKFTQNPKVCCNKGDILLTVKGSGAGSVIISDAIYCISRQLMALRASDEISGFLFYQLLSRENNYNLDSVGLIPGITRRDVLCTLIPMPSMPSEAIRIAEILSTGDHVIELKEKLLEQKQLQKKGLLERLLTGKVRLPGFNGKWKQLKAGELFGNSSDKKHGGVGEVLSSLQDRGIVPRSQVDIAIKYDAESLVSYKRVEAGDFVISLRSFQGGIEYSEYDGLISPAYTVIKAKKDIDKGLYKELFKSANFIRRLNSVICGIRDGKQIGYNDFATLKVPYPPREEQSAIASIFRVVNDEIALLKSELKQLKTQKKGLMQLLLTGKVRAPCAEREA